MSEQDHTTEKRSAGKRIMSDAVHMPIWQKALLFVAITVGVVGVAVQATSQSTPTPPGQTPADNPSAAPEGTRRGFVSGNPQAGPAETAPQQPEQTWLQRNSGTMSKSGLGFAGAFIVGWLFRLFLKTMAFLALMGVGILLALSYFNIITIDTAAARQHYESFSTWLGGQAGHLKDFAMAHLPASSSSAAGLFAGLWKK
jgi:uncharacterized membrane protein (Fun14 family)